MSAPSSSGSPHPAYAGSQSTAATLPNGRTPSAHLHRHVPTPFLVPPAETGTPSGRLPLAACGLRSGHTWRAYAEHFGDLRARHPHAHLKTLTFLRHAQGRHNEAEARFGTAVWDAVESLKDEWSDPELTELGVQQCRALAEVMPKAVEEGLKPQLIVTSPLQRTLQTAELCLEQSFYASVPVIAVEHARETLGEHTCDRRSTVTAMQQRFGRWVQFHLIPDDADPLWTPTRETDALELLRAQRFLDFLWSLPEEHIVLVGHSGMLTALANLFWKPLEEGEQAPPLPFPADAATNDSVLEYLVRDGALSHGGIHCRHCELQPFCVARLPLAFPSPAPSSSSPHAPLAAPHAPARRLAFATSSEDPELTPDDQAVAALLRQQGVEVVAVVWDAPESIASLQGLDGLVLRSCWNYHRKLAAFQEWLATVREMEERGELKVANPLRASAWNLDKRYLVSLGEAGARVPRTVHLPAGAPIEAVHAAVASVAGGAAGVESSRVVLKPAVSASGHDTFRVWARERAEVEARASGILHAQGRAMLVQEYLPEIETTGECSFVFLNGTLSHAVRKRPGDAANEFRIQTEYGGRQAEYTPTRHMIGKAREYLQHIPDAGRILFARVDAVERGDELILVELEVIDPSLYHDLAPGSEKRFAQAIMDYFK